MDILAQLLGAGAGIAGVLFVMLFLVSILLIYVWPIWTILLFRRHLQEMSAIRELLERAEIRRTEPPLPRPSPEAVGAIATSAFGR
jgi:hypothetical protein